MCIPVPIYVPAREHLAQLAVGSRKVKIIQRYLLLVVAHIQFIFLMLMPWCLYHKILHTVVFAHLVTYILSYAVQLVIVITHQFNSVIAILQVQRVTETSLAHAAGCPVGTSDGYNLSNYLILQYVGERGTFVFLLKLHRYISAPTAYARLKAFYLREGHQEVLQHHHLLVQLGSCTSQRHLGTNIENT